MPGDNPRFWNSSAQSSCLHPYFYIDALFSCTEKCSSRCSSVLCISSDKEESLTNLPRYPVPLGHEVCLKGLSEVPIPLRNNLDIFAVLPLCIKTTADCPLNNALQVGSLCIMQEVFYNLPLLSAICKYPVERYCSMSCWKASSKNFWRSFSFICWVCSMSKTFCACSASSSAEHKTNKQIMYCRCIPPLSEFKTYRTCSINSDRLLLQAVNTGCRKRRSLCFATVF